MKLTNKITALILLVLSLAVLSSCVQRAPGVQAQTTEGNSDTETSLENLEFKLEMPSEELQERFVNEYIAYRNYDPQNHPTVAIETWFGSFGDIHFLFVGDGGLEYTDALWTDSVADCSFAYPTGQSIRVWVDGQFLLIKQAYEQNQITADMVKTIENIYNGIDGHRIKMSEQ